MFSERPGSRTPFQMDRMLTTVAKLAGSSSRNDDDLVDRLHNRYTVLFLVIFAVVVSTNQYVGTPINCWAPAYFTDNHQRYADRVRSVDVQPQSSDSTKDVAT